MYSKFISSQKWDSTADFFLWFQGLKPSLWGREGGPEVTCQRSGAPWLFPNALPCSHRFELCIVAGAPGKGLHAEGRAWGRPSLQFKGSRSGNASLGLWFQSLSRSWTPSLRGSREWEVRGGVGTDTPLAQSCQPCGPTMASEPENPQRLKNPRIACRNPGAFAHNASKGCPLPRTNQELLPAQPRQDSIMCSWMKGSGVQRWTPSSGLTQG